MPSKKLLVKYDEYKELLLSLLPKPDQLEEKKNILYTEFGTYTVVIGIDKLDEEYGGEQVVLSWMGIGRSGHFKEDEINASVLNEVAQEIKDNAYKPKDPKNAAEVSEDEEDEDEDAGDGDYDRVLDGIDQ